MNPGLLRAIRDQKSSESSDDLLRLWVENDRGTYSDETFEAVRSILGERGVELPPQNDPPPVAERATVRYVDIVSKDPVAAFWLAWLRAVLWIGVAVGVVQVIGWLFLLWWFLHGYWRVGTPLALTPSDALLTPVGRLLILNAVFVVWSFVSIRLGFMLHRRARGVLIAYAWTSILATVLWTGSNLYTTASAQEAPYEWVYTASHSAHDLQLTLYPAILLLLLSRPQVRELFHRAVTPAFEVARVSADVPECTGPGNLPSEERP